MAKKKRGPSRKDLRREAEAVEAREREEEEQDDEELEDDESDDEEELEDESEDDDEEDEDEEAPKQKKKAAKKKTEAKKPAGKRTRTVKEVRMRAVWVVFDNGSKRVGVFPFNEKKQAEKFLNQKIEEKKSTFYLQLVKEPLEESEAPTKPAKK